MNGHRRGSEHEETDRHQITEEGLSIRGEHHGERLPVEKLERVDAIIGGIVPIPGGEGVDTIQAEEGRQENDGCQKKPLDAADPRLPASG
jgi:hypothetical protein